MRFKIIDEFNFIIFLIKDKVKNINIKNYKELEEYFRILFSNLSNLGDFILKGFYDVCLYKDNNFGIILDVKKDELDLKYCDEIDIRVLGKFDGPFMYKIDDLDYVTDYLTRFRIYYYDSSFYLLINEDFDIKNIIEYVDVIYGDDIEEIINYGEELEVK